jgi:hypothetical protein
VALLDCGVRDDSTSLRQTPAPAEPTTSVAPLETANDVVDATRAQFRLAAPPQFARRPPIWRPAAAPAIDSPRDALKLAATQRFARSAGGFAPVFGVEAREAETRPAHVTYAGTADGPFRLTDAASGMAIAVRMRGAISTPAELGHGYLVYRGAHPSGGHVLHRATPEGTEDFVTMLRGGSDELSYDVELSDGVAGLRLVANVLEFLDEGGAPRLRIAPPYVVDAAGKKFAASLAVEGVPVDRNPAAPWNRPVTPPGTSHVAVRVSWDGSGAVRPVLVDPSWTATGNMITGRTQHIAENLNGRTILVAGGATDAFATVLSSAEIYSYATGTWAATDSMLLPRFLASSGRITVGGSVTKVLVASGYGNGRTTVLSAETYDPSTGHWTATGNNLTSSHVSGRAVVYTDSIANTQKIALIGGYADDSINPLTLPRNIDIYDPTNAGTPFSSPSLIPVSGRYFHGATLLNDGTILVTGGFDGTSTLQSAPIYRPTTNTWTSAPNLGTAREAHAQVTLANGNTVIFGGDNGVLVVATTQIYAPGGSWSAGGSLSTGRQSVHGIILSNGDILAVGGNINADGTGPLNTAEVFDPTLAAGAGAWSGAGTMSVTRQDGFTLSAMNTGDVVVAAGSTDITLPTVTNKTDLFSFNARLGAACVANSNCTTGFCVDGVCCENACGGGSTADCQACSAAAGSTARDGFCRGAVGTCDVPETCNGVLTTCPADAFAPSSTLCRAATGPCDMPEYCTGSSPSCPGDAFVSAGTQCRWPVGSCEIAATCDGLSAGCPANGIKPDGTACGASSACRGGSCTSSVSDAGAGDATSSDTGASDTGSGDVTSMDADARASETGAMDTGVVDTGSMDTGSIDARSSDAPLGDTGSSDARVTDGPSSDVSPIEASDLADARADARVPDSGSDSSASGDAADAGEDGGANAPGVVSGCSCHAGGSAPLGTDAPLIGIALGGLALFRLRRRAGPASRDPTRGQR